VLAVSAEDSEGNQQAPASRSRVLLRTLHGRHAAVNAALQRLCCLLHCWSAEHCLFYGLEAESPEVSLPKNTFSERSHMSAQDSSSGQHRTVTDFYRSFLRFRIDLKITQPRTVSQPPPFTLNNARFPLESVLRMTQPTATGGKTTQYVLGSSCKAEQVHVTENVWHEPAADMCLVASPEEFLVIKSWDRNNRGVMLSPPTLGEQPERQVGRCSDAFTALNLTHKFAGCQTADCPRRRSSMPC
jgi:hypothetical protein